MSYVLYLMILVCVKNGEPYSLTGWGVVRESCWGDRGGQQTGGQRTGTHQAGHGTWLWCKCLITQYGNKTFLQIVTSSLSPKSTQKRTVHTVSVMPLLSSGIHCLTVFTMLSLSLLSNVHSRLTCSIFISHQIWLKNFLIPTSICVAQDYWMALMSS
jgi:hypothetical protein